MAAVVVCADVLLALCWLLNLVVQQQEALPGGAALQDVVGIKVAPAAGAEGALEESAWKEGAASCCC